MHRRTSLRFAATLALALLAVVGIALPSLAGAADARAQSRCPTSGKTLKRTPTVRFWQTKGTQKTYACAFSVGRVVRLNTKSTVVGGALVSAGTTIAYDTVGDFSFRVVVRSLRTGRTLHTAPVNPQVDIGEASPLSALLVTPSGSVAWTASVECYCEGVDPSVKGYNVYAIGADDRRVMLDGGKTVAAGLKLTDDGRTVVWTNDGQERTAPLT